MRSTVASRPVCAGPRWYSRHVIRAHLAAELLVDGERLPAFVWTIDHPEGRVLGGDVAVSFGELGSGATEGQRRVLALEALTWLSHATEPKIPERQPST